MKNSLGPVVYVVILCVGFGFLALAVSDNATNEEPLLEEVVLPEASAYPWSGEDVVQRINYVEWHMEKAARCFREKNYELGIALLQDAIEACPDSTGDERFDRQFQSMRRQLRAVIVDTRRGLGEESVVGE